MFSWGCACGSCPEDNALDCSIARMNCCGDAASVGSTVSLKRMRSLMSAGCLSGTAAHRSFTTPARSARYSNTNWLMSEPGRTSMWGAERYAVSRPWSHRFRSISMGGSGEAWECGRAKLSAVRAVWLAGRGAGRFRGICRADLSVVLVPLPCAKRLLLRQQDRDAHEAGGQAAGDLVCAKGVECGAVKADRFQQG